MGKPLRRSVYPARWVPACHDGSCGEPAAYRFRWVGGECPRWPVWHGQHWAF